MKLFKRFLLNILLKKKMKRSFYTKLSVKMFIDWFLKNELILFVVYTITNMIVFIKTIYFELIQTIWLVLTYNYFLKYQEMSKLDTFFINTFLVFLYNLWLIFGKAPLTMLLKKSSFINSNIIFFYYNKYYSWFCSLGLIYWTMLVNFFKTINLSTQLQVVKYFLSMILIMFMFFLCSINSIIYFKFFYKYLIVSIFMYLLFSTFLNINKSVQSGKYTSVIQRFWKSSYYLFWSIEFFLFFMFIYLTCTHASESHYFLDWKLVSNILFDNSVNFFYFLFLIQLLMMMNYYIIFLHKYNNYMLMNILFILLSLMIYIIMFYEFSKLFYMMI